jgi:hypothetical protein
VLDRRDRDAPLVRACRRKAQDRQVVRLRAASGEQDLRGVVCADEPGDRSTRLLDRLAREDARCV